jgi:hypothetical protein
MKTFIALAAVAIALPSIASAEDLKPLEGGSFRLGDQAVSIYYTESGQNYQVVTTIAPEVDSPGAPIRFVSHLRPGEAETVSVGAFGAASAAEMLELVHTGDGLSVAQKIETALLD